jgi:exosortase A-associated hydrolase 1
MDKNMRRIVQFLCGEATLFGTLDEGMSTTGLLIVSGGNEIRIGAHRGMAELAQKIASIGYPVFRFDRRGIGDSEGENNGFDSSGPDIDAASAAFRAVCPHITRIVAFGNCDAATALVLHDNKADGLVLANPWILEQSDDLPPAAAIKDRYARRLKEPSAWWALITGNFDIRNAMRGLRRISTMRRETIGLRDRFASGLVNDRRPTTILLAIGDNTAIAFADAWNRPVFEAARNRADVRIVRFESASHSFASEADFALLVKTLTDALAQ